MKWTANASYLVNSKDQQITRISGRRFYKKNAGQAICVATYPSTTGYCGPILISDDPNAVLYYTDYGTCGYNSVVIDGVTWYISGYDMWMSGNYIHNTDGTPEFDMTQCSSPSAYTEIIQKIFLQADFSILSYKSSGQAIFTVSSYTKGNNDRLSWVGTTPTGTSLRLYTKVNNGSYTEATNGGSIPGLPDGTCTLYVKAELTSDGLETPSLSQVLIQSDADAYKLVLTTALPNFSSAVGNMSVSYDGLGGLQGQGGPSESFTSTFTPSGLTWKGHQCDEEHFTMSASATATLVPIAYTNTQENEHIELAMSAVAMLIDVHDL